MGHSQFKSSVQYIKWTQYNGHCVPSLATVDTSPLTGLIAFLSADDELGVRVLAALRTDGYIVLRHVLSDGECALSGAGTLVCKNANNGAHIRTANTIIAAPLMISGSLDKTDDCSDHYIKVSTQSTDSGAPWSNRPGFVTFVWNCDYRAIYGQTGVVSTYQPLRQTYDIQITIDESTVTFRDPTEEETVTIDCRSDICTDDGNDCCASEKWMLVFGAFLAEGWSAMVSPMFVFEGIGGWGGGFRKQRKKRKHQTNFFTRPLCAGTVAV